VQIQCLFALQHALPDELNIPHRVMVLRSCRGHIGSIVSAPHASFHDLQ
jgi:hypothetical protein